MSGPPPLAAARRLGGGGELAGPLNPHLRRAATTGACARRTAPLQDSGKTSRDTTRGGSLSTITVPTRMLVNLLDDLLLTASKDPDLPHVLGVLLHTADGEFVIDLPPDSSEHPLIDSVESALLVGTSTDTYAMAQAHAPCDADGPAGWIAAAFVSRMDAEAVARAFKPLIGTLGRETTHRSVMELAAGRLTVREDPTQVPDGLSMWFPVGDGATFPAVEKLLRPDPMVQSAGRDGEIIPPSYGTGLPARYVEAFGKIGRRRKMPLAVYRHHQHAPIVVEIGAGYRAVVNPLQLDEESGQHHAPMIRVFDPPRRERRLEAVRDE